jgi:hypothetical protein
VRTAAEDRVRKAAASTKTKREEVSEDKIVVRQRASW